MPGTRCARAAPSTSPIANAPTMPRNATSSVRASPCASSPRLSQITDQSKAASTIRKRRGRPSFARPPSETTPLRANRFRHRPSRVPEAVFRPRNVVHELPVEERRRVPLQDLRELVPLLHPRERGVDPACHDGLVLADPDPPRDLEELVRRQLERLVLRRDA